MINTIIQGDVLERLKQLPNDYVQTVITSPPYFGLRDYGVTGQIGLEETPQAYIDKLVAVFREGRRVLRPDGTLWLNIGDSYAGSGKGGQSEEKRSENWQPTYMNKGLTPRGYKPKDLMMIPARLAIALQSDGWYLRSQIIWHKPNCMPESVEDRPTTSHEYVFLLAKSEKYYYDADAIREPVSLAHIEKWGTATPERKPPKTHIGLEITRIQGEATTYGAHPLGRNKRSVWSVSTHNYEGAHFATFPPKLIEPMILAGTAPRACEHCGAPWERVTERIQFGKAPSATKFDKTMQGGPLSGSRQAYRAMGLEGPPAPITTGWQPTCTCTNEGTGRCIVLDPFMGSGTVALVAIQHARHWLGIELSPDYVALAQKRIACVQVNMWESEVAV